MTGMHAMHMIVGVGLLITLIVMAARDRFSGELVHAGRIDRPVLALRRHCVDFSVPAALFDWTHIMTHPTVPVRTYALVFLALIALTITTVFVSKIELGEYNFICAMTIAVIKATLVVWFFMHVRHSTSMTKLFVGAGFFWMAILIVFRSATTSAADGCRRRSGGESAEVRAHRTAIRKARLRLRRRLLVSKATAFGAEKLPTRAAPRPSRVPS